MSHMVIFNGTEGQPRYHQADTLEDAVKFAEHLRNAEDLDNTKIYKLSEVVFEFRPYFRVEVGAAADEATETELFVDSAEPAEAVDEVEIEEKAEEEAVEPDRDNDTDKDHAEGPLESERVESPKSSRIFSRS
jgi:hypothetical protein